MFFRTRISFLLSTLSVSSPMFFISFSLVVIVFSVLFCSLFVKRFTQMLVKLGSLHIYKVGLKKLI